MMDSLLDNMDVLADIEQLDHPVWCCRMLGVSKRLYHLTLPGFYKKLHFVLDGDILSPSAPLERR